MDPNIDADRDGVPNVIDADFEPAPAFGGPAFGAPAAPSWDQDADGIPDSIDASVDVPDDPAAFGAATPSLYSPAEQEMLDAIGDPEQRALMELQMRQQRESLMQSTMTNVSNTRHEMAKDLADNLRG